MNYKKLCYMFAHMLVCKQECDVFKIDYINFEKDVRKCCYAIYVKYHTLKEQKMLVTHINESEFDKLYENEVCKTNI